MELNDLFGFKGKNVLVTGAGSGMGHAAAKLLAELGANVYATIRRTALDFKVEKELRVDLSQKAELERLAAELPEQLDALLICHGISDALGKTNALDVQVTNFLSFKYLTELLLPRVVDNGSVTFISSNGGKKWRGAVKLCRELVETVSWEEGLAWYSAHPEKTGEGYTFAKECQHVYAMLKCRAPEFIDRRIRINVISPGMTKTGLTEDFNASITGDAAQGQAILENMFLAPWNGRWAAPEEMGYPMVAVASQIFSYMSGQILYIDYGDTPHWELAEAETLAE